MMAPIWRFALAPGVAGPLPMLGVMMPSVDRVGRQFPLTLAAPMAEASPLRHSPHTVHDIADDNWSRAYRRTEGCFPAGTSRSDKYWSPVGRVDNVYGDRNLVCSCPPIADYAQAAE